MTARTFILLALIALAFATLGVTPGASAQDTWSGTGTYTVSSTPSAGSPCTGQGTAQITLDGTPGGSITADLTFQLTSQSSGCGGALNGGSDPSISGTLSGDTLSASDSYGDSFTGTLTSTTLQLSYTSPYTSGCADLCQDNAQFSFTGSGDLATGAGLASLGSPDAVASIMGAVLGVVAIGLAIASLPGRIPPAPSASASGVAPVQPLPLQQVPLQVVPPQPAVPQPYAPQPYPLQPGGPPVVLNVPPGQGVGIVPVGNITVSNGIPYNGPENPGVYSADPNSPTGWRWKDPRTGAWFPAPDSYTQWYGQGAH